MTVTIFSSHPWRMLRVSPGLSSRLGFGRWLLTLIFPFSMAALARLRVLKKRAAHSHLSIRTLSIVAGSCGVGARKNFIEMVDGGKVRSVHELSLAIGLSDGAEVGNAKAFRRLEYAQRIVDKQGS